MITSPNMRQLEHVTITTEAYPHRGYTPDKFKLYENF